MSVNEIKLALNSDANYTKQILIHKLLFSKPFFLVFGDFFFSEIKNITLIHALFTRELFSIEI